MPRSTPSSAPPTRPTGVPYWEVFEAAFALEHRAAYGKDSAPGSVRRDHLRTSASRFTIVEARLGGPAGRTRRVVRGPLCAAGALASKGGASGAPARSTLTGTAARLQFVSRLA